MIITGLAVQIQGAAVLGTRIVATFGLAARPSGARSRLCTRRNDNAPRLRFSATLGEEPVVEMRLVWQLCYRDLFAECVQEEENSRKLTLLDFENTQYGGCMYLPLLPS